MQNSILRSLGTHSNDVKIFFSSRLFTWGRPVAQLGHGGPQVGQVDKGLSGFEVLPCPLHLKKFSDKMT